MPPLSTNPPMVTLNWVDNATTETGYVVVRATDKGMTQNRVLTPLPANTTSWVDDSPARHRDRLQLPCLRDQRRWQLRTVGTGACGAWPAVGAGDGERGHRHQRCRGRRRRPTHRHGGLDEPAQRQRRFGGDGPRGPAFDDACVRCADDHGRPARHGDVRGDEPAAQHDLLLRVRTTNASGQTFSNVVSVTTLP